MDLIELRKKQSFLTIRKNEYNHNLGRNIERVFRLFDKKTEILPPTIDYIFNEPGSIKLDPIKKTLGLKVKESSKKDKIKFADIIKIQEEVLRIVKKRNEQFNYRCGLIKLVTGGGKSHVIMDITNYYQTNALILVHNIKTLSEMCEKFVKYTNILPSQYGDGKKEIGNITIMTKKSFCTDYKKLNTSFGLVLIDEAPIYFSKSFWNSVNDLFYGKKGIGLYGFSGTPYTIDLTEKDLNKWFGSTIEVKRKENNGYNFIPDFTMYDYIVDDWKYEYENPAEMRTEVSENMDRYFDQEQQIKELFKDRKCLLILTDRVSEADRFYKLGGFGFTFLMTGATKTIDDNRNIESAKKLVKSGKKVCIIGTIQKVKAGVDIPFIDTIFLASAIKFGANVIQAIGRGVRICEGKTSISVGVWNDLPHYKKQKTEKIKVIKKEYLLKDNDIEIVKILRKRKKNINK